MTQPVTIAEVETAIRALPAELTERQIPLWRWTFCLARRLMKYRVLGTAYQATASALFLDAVKKSGADPDGRMHPEGVLADLYRFAAVPPRQAERESPLDSAFEETKNMRLRFIRTSGPLYDQIGTIAFHLAMIAWKSLPKEEQAYTDHVAIFLPQKNLAQRLGVHQSTVSSIIGLLVLHGVLEVVNAQWSYTRRQAKTYRFLAQEGAGDFTTEEGET